MKGEIQVTDSDGNHAPEPARRPVDDGLDRLDAALLRWAQSEWHEDYPAAVAALATVRSELERLRDQVKFCPYCAGAFVPESLTYEGPCEGCKIAERLREERDSWVETYLDRGRDLAAAELRAKDMMNRRNYVTELLGERIQERDDALDERDYQRGRAEAAEAEVRRLTEGLREMRQDLDYNEGSVAKFDMKLRALLAASPSDGGGVKCPNSRCNGGWVAYEPNESGGAPPIACRHEDCPHGGGA